MRIRNLSFWSLVLLVFALFGGYVWTEHTAQAFDYFGRQPTEAYFSGSMPGMGRYVFDWSNDLQYQGIGPDWDTTPMTRQKFIDEYWRRLNSTSDFNRGRAAGTIAIMMGINAADPRFDGPSPNRWENGVTWAKANFSNWANLIQDYETQGLVNFNDFYTAKDPIDWLGAATANGDVLPDLVSVQLSDNFINEKAVVFYLPDGKQLVILKKCANMPGFPEPLQPLTPPSTPPSGTINADCSTVSGTVIDPSRPNTALPVRITFSSGGDINTTTNQSGAFSVATPNAVLNSASTVDVTVYAADSGGNPVKIGQRTAGPCLAANASCGQLTTTPGAIDPLAVFQVATAVKYGSLIAATTARSAPDFRYFITITGPNGYNFSDGNVAASQPDPSSFAISGTASRPPANTTGTYTVAWGVIGGFGAINCSSEFFILNRPYFKVQGSGISAGEGFDVGSTNCTQPGAVAKNPLGSIVSWNGGTANGYSGSGSTYDATVLNHIQDFATAQTTAGLAPSSLAFANTGSPNPVDNTKDIWGGGFGSLNCLPDYFQPTSGSTVVSGNQKLSDLITAATGASVLPGSTFTVPNRARLALYVNNGNVLIDVNIRYTGTYATLSDVPFFGLVVKGDIDIDPAVTTLDGFYIAQPSGPGLTNGIIYTCAPYGFNTNAVSAPVLTSSLYSQCNSILTVNGALVGRQVWLLRSAGTVNGPTAAESINYLPEMWIGIPYGVGLGGGQTDSYDSITGLPPIL